MVQHFSSVIAVVLAFVPSFSVFWDGACWSCASPVNGDTGLALCASLCPHACRELLTGSASKGQLRISMWWLKLGLNKLNFNLWLCHFCSFPPFPPALDIKKWSSFWTAFWCFYSLISSTYIIIQMWHTWFRSNIAAWPWPKHTYVESYGMCFLLADHTHHLLKQNFWFDLNSTIVLKFQSNKTKNVSFSVIAILEDEWKMNKGRKNTRCWLLIANMPMVNTVKTCIYSIQLLV